jgi:hypothetical protein
VVGVWMEGLVITTSFETRPAVRELHVAARYIPPSIAFQ